VIIELRQYTLRPGQWEVLSNLFLRELAEGQEAVGMSIMGWFRDLDRSDRFVWLRSFRDMPDRARALAAFYDGPVWAQHREAANATMVDSDNVLLLRPTRRGTGVAIGRHEPPVVASIHHFPEPVSDDVLDGLDRDFGRAGATWVSEESPNNFPRLPIREGEHVVVRFSTRPEPGADEILRLEAPSGPLRHR
jgi:NIPSNAP